MSTAAAFGSPSRRRPTAEQVADALDVVDGVGQELVAAARQIGLARQPVSDTAVQQLERVLPRLRDATQVRAALSRLAPELLLAAAAVRRNRSRGCTVPHLRVLEPAEVTR